MRAVSRRYYTLVDLAACAEADPILFDATTIEDAHEALTYCRRCPVASLCLSEIRPDRVWYDGVVGGLVWRNGEPITLNPTKGPRA